VDSVDAFSLLQNMAPMSFDGSRLIDIACIAYAQARGAVGWPRARRARRPALSRPGMRAQPRPGRSRQAAPAPRVARPAPLMDRRRAGGRPNAGGAAGRVL